MHRYKIDPTKGLLGSGGEGKVLEVIKLREDGTEEGMFVMKQRMCTSIEEANSGLSEVLLSLFLSFSIFLLFPFIFLFSLLFYSYKYLILLYATLWWNIQIIIFPAHHHRLISS